jgi:hypothetical protein
VLPLVVWIFEVNSGKPGPKAVSTKGREKSLSVAPLISGTSGPVSERVGLGIQTVLKVTPHGSRATPVPLAGVAPTPMHRPVSTPKGAY